MVTPTLTCINQYFVCNGYWDHEYWRELQVAADGDHPQVSLIARNAPAHTSDFMALHAPY